MIGDPPSMILAGYLKMGFWDFFIFQGKLGIFFAVQLGMIASLIVLWILYRRHHEKTNLIFQEKAKSWVPAYLLGALIVGLSFASVVDPDFSWFAGVYTLVLSVIALAWFRLYAKWGSTRKLIKALDWDTTFFLIGVFVLVGGLSDSGWMNRLAVVISESVGNSPFMAFSLIVFVAVAVSAFVDNVPFLLVMIPVVQSVSDTIQVPLPLLMFGLLIGACLGGNLSPIGASANIVTLGILKKRGYPVTFRTFMGIGVPFTISAVLAASLFVWWLWGV